MQDFPKVPTSWEELTSLREYLTDCDVLFLRHAEDQARYKSQTDSIPREQVLKNITDQLHGKRVGIVKNTFPHTNVLQNFPHALHYCLWSLDGALDDTRISEEVEKVFTGATWMSMTRAEGKFSIPEIWHTHIYVNNK